MALYFGWRINKKALLQTVFLAILPTGSKVSIIILLSIPYGHMRYIVASIRILPSGSANV